MRQIWGLRTWAWRWAAGAAVGALAGLGIGQVAPAQVAATGSAAVAGTVGDAGDTSGYWMLDGAGRVHAFGAATLAGDPSSTPGVDAVDVAAVPGGSYLVLDRGGRVWQGGAPAPFGGLPSGWLAAGEEATSISATPSGRGYWVFTSHGRVRVFGDAQHLGDMAGVRLNAPVLDSVATPGGGGYYMVSSDGGIFTFGDAGFRGSMGGIPLVAPVRALAPDRDGDGYWLVAADGGVFAFEAPFRGSMGGTRLNQPVVGMVAFGDGYLLVAADGGIFTFSDRPFHGSLGGQQVPHPIVSAAAVPDGGGAC